MTGAWSRPPVGRVVPQAELGALGKNLGENNGESRRVCRLEKHPNWIFKEYPKPVPLVGIKRLDQLIKLPQQMSAADKALVDGHTSWPASRVIDPQQKTIGVLMPLAPPTYSADRQLPSGRSESRVLEVDVLALTEDRQKARKLPPQSLADRISVCASIAAVGALFERHGLVYLDWSYANIFWSLGDHSAYVIDLDGCSFGPRPQIQVPNWDDPLVPRGSNAGNESDRYRVALLIARCLTGMRANLTETKAGLSGLEMRGGTTGEIAGLLIQTLNARSTAQRPSIAEISMALEAPSSPVGEEGDAPGLSSRGIFLSYRREDTAYPAAWLYNRLAERFGGGQVFKDVDSIEPGDDFVEVITTAVGSCRVLLALIGDRWLTVTDEEGRRRIDDADDFVRLEIEAALTRNIRVVPILVGGARMPRADDLPASLAKLARRQALELSPDRFDSDLSRLLRVLEQQGKPGR